MKSLTNILLKGAMLFALIVLGQNLHAQSVSTSASPSDVTAIYILLQPDAAMLKHAETNNARQANLQTGARQGAGEAIATSGQLRTESLA